MQGRLVVVCFLLALALEPVLSAPRVGTAHANDAVSLLQLGSTTGGVSDALTKAGIDIEGTKISGTVLFGVLGFSVALLFLIAKGMAPWSFPPFGLDNSEQTATNVVSNWLEMVSTIMAIALALLIKSYSVYRRFSSDSLFHSPHESSVSLSDGLASLTPYYSQNSLATFLQSEAERHFFLDQEGDDGSDSTAMPLSLKQWLSPELDESNPDPLRMLARFYYVDNQAKQKLAKENIHVGIDDVHTMLKKAYEWRLDCWRLAHVTTSLELTLAQSPERAELKAQRAKLLTSTSEKQRGLKKLFRPAWENLGRHVRFTEYSELSKGWLSDTESWGSTMLAVGMIFANLYSFLDRSPECPPLLNPDRSIRQGLIRLNMDGTQHAPLPHIYNARTWACTHMNTINTEEGSTCELTCEHGYRSELGTTKCDSMGGGGMAWTHLESELLNSAQLDMPSCCINTPDAANLNAGFLARMASADLAVFEWTQDVGFSHSCGWNQTVLAQVCVYKPSDVPSSDVAASVCSALCPHPDTESDNCAVTKSTELVPVDEWGALEGLSAKKVLRQFEGKSYSDMMQAGVAEHEAGTRIAEVKVTVPAGSSTLVRLAVTNINGVVAGPWREVVA